MRKDRIGLSPTTGVVAGATGEGPVDMAYGGINSITTAIVIRDSTATTVQRVWVSVRKEHLKSRACLRLDVLRIEHPGWGVAMRRSDCQLPKHGLEGNNENVKLSRKKKKEKARSR